MNICARAPGRVNLIGEHTDYNRGYVLPVAIELELVLEFRCRSDRLITVRSENYRETAVASIDNLTPLKNEPDWIDYIKSIFWIFIKEGFEIAGADMRIKSNIPGGSGLSSSAALELAVAAALNKSNELGVDLKKMALMCYEAENHYIGVRCGIMDQFAVALAKKGTALFIDCLTENYSYIPVKLGEYTILIVDSRVDRSLASSAYNKRREECDDAVTLLSQITGDNISSLREIKIETLNKLKYKMADTTYRRSLFVVEENERVLKAMRALEQEDLPLFGELLKASHIGLRDLFEVSCEELNVITDTASAQKGVLGARITGAGFGGCAIVLLKSDSVEQVKEAINKQFENRGWRQPDYYLSEASSGLSVW